MLKGVSPILSPELIKALAEMGHGDEIILADAHFPGHSIGPSVIRADGLAIVPLLDGIMPVFSLDSYDKPLLMMAPVPGDKLDPKVEQSFMEAIRKHDPKAPDPERLERFAFYERAKKAYRIVMTGDVSPYANLILKKGVIIP